MRYTYCPDCGAKLVFRPIGDDGPTPYCPRCERPWFDGFPSCVLVLVHDGAGDILLLQEDYISTRYKNLVSGYIKPGERGEEAALREVREETGLTCRDVRIVGTWWFPEKGLLMIGFLARAESRDLALSGEVDGAAWTDAHKALSLVAPRGPENATHYVVEAYLAAFPEKEEKR